jgi:hypothetical protein
VYSACGRLGGIDRIHIFREDSRGTCTGITLASPAAEGTGLAITLPFTWSVEAAAISAAPGGCPIPPAYGSGWVSAANGSGAISWQGVAWPDASGIDVHVQLSFPPTAGLPSSDALDAVGISLAYCP